MVVPLSTFPACLRPKVPSRFRRSATPPGGRAWRRSLGPDAVSRRLRAITEDGIGIEPLYAPGGPGDGEARNLAGRVVGLLPAGEQGWKIRQRFPVNAARADDRRWRSRRGPSIEFTCERNRRAFLKLFALLRDLGLAGIETSLEGNFARGRLPGRCRRREVRPGSPSASIPSAPSCGTEPRRELVPRRRHGWPPQGVEPAGDIPLRASGDLSSMPARRPE